MPKSTYQSAAVGFAIMQATRTFVRSQGFSEDTTADELADRIVPMRTLLDAVIDKVMPTLGTGIRHMVGPVPGEVVRVRGSRKDRVLLYLHGGGYNVCSPRTHRPLVRALARASRTTAVVPEYRLAPEHPFPAALEDALATYRWLLEEKGVPPEHVAVAGDSAGGGLSLCLLLAARDEDLPMPACYAGMSPWTDLTGSSPSIAENNGRDKLFGKVPESLAARLGEVYAGDDTANPLASPVYGDFTGLPPMLVHVGSDELIRDDGLRVVERAREAGVEASAGVFDGMWHVWQIFPLPEARRSLREIGGFMRRHLPD